MNDSCSTVTGPLNFHFVKTPSELATWTSEGDVGCTGEKPVMNQATRNATHSQIADGAYCGSACAFAPGSLRKKVDASLLYEEPVLLEQACSVHSSSS